MHNVVKNQLNYFAQCKLLSLLWSTAKKTGNKTTSTNNLRLQRAKLWLHTFLFFGAFFIFFDDTVVQFECNGEHVSAVVESSEYAMSGTVQAVCERRLQAVKHHAFSTVFFLQAICKRRRCKPGANANCLITTVSHKARAVCQTNENTQENISTCIQMVQMENKNIKVNIMYHLLNAKMICLLKLRRASVW